MALLVATARSLVLQIQLAMVKGLVLTLVGVTASRALWGIAVSISATETPPAAAVVNVPRMAIASATCVTTSWTAQRCAMGTGLAVLVFVSVTRVTLVSTAIPYVTITACAVQMGRVSVRRVGEGISAQLLAVQVRMRTVQVTGYAMPLSTSVTVSHGGRAQVAPCLIVQENQTVLTGEFVTQPSYPQSAKIVQMAGWVQIVTRHVYMEIRFQWIVGFVCATPAGLRRGAILNALDMVCVVQTMSPVTVIHLRDGEERSVRYQVVLDLGKTAPDMVTVTAQPMSALAFLVGLAWLVTSQTAQVNLIVQIAGFVMPPLTLRFA